MRERQRGRDREGEKETAWESGGETERDKKIGRAHV